MINPGDIPQIPGDMDVLTLYATVIKNVGSDFATTGEQVDTTWQALPAVYVAPEASDLFAATGPVRTKSSSVGEDIEAVGTALIAYAETVAEIKAELEALKGDATDFVDSVEDDDDWNKDEDKVERHNGLISAVNAQVAAFFEAQRTCANTINALWGGQQYEAEDGDGEVSEDEYGFTADQLDEAAGEDDALPWGSTEEHEEDRGLLGDVGAFVGGVKDGFVGTVEGLGALIGRDPETGEWSWGTAGQAWTGLGTFAYSAAIYSSPALILIDQTVGMPLLDRRQAGNTLLGAFQSTVAWDTWGEDNPRAAGLTTFNVVSAVIGTKGAGATMRGTGTAVRTVSTGATAARVSTALIRAGNWLDSLPSVLDVAGNVAHRFDIEIPNFSGRSPDLPGDGTPGNFDFDFDVPDVDVPDFDGHQMDIDSGNGGNPLGGNGPDGNRPDIELPNIDPPDIEPPNSNDPSGSNEPPNNTDSSGSNPLGGHPPGGDPPANNSPAASGPDPFDQLDPATQQRLVDDVIADSNKDFPMTRENAEAVLRGGPPGTTPRVAGEGVQGGDVQFVDADGNTLLGRENKSIAGGYNSFNGAVKHAALEQLGGQGEVWVQVRPGTDVDSWIHRFQGSRPPDRLSAYEGVDVIFRDPDGNVLGEYNLGTKLPPRQ